MQRIFVLCAFPTFLVAIREAVQNVLIKQDYAPSALLLMRREQKKTDVSYMVLIIIIYIEKKILKTTCHF